MRLIDADNLKKYGFKIEFFKEDGSKAKIIGVQHKEIDWMPTIDPVVHGHWINPVNDTLECSQCGAWCEKVLLGEYLMPKYCGNCGAKNDET